MEDLEVKSEGSAEVEDGKFDENTLGKIYGVGSVVYYVGSLGILAGLILYVFMSRIPSNVYVKIYITSFLIMESGRILRDLSNYFSGKLKQKEVFTCIAASLVLMVVFTVIPMLLNF